MNKLELIKKDLEEGADYNFDNWNKGDLQMLEEIVIATENVVKKLNIPVVSQQSEQCEGKCGMSYCDDNGCIDRKRNLVEPKDKPEHCG